MKKWLLLALSIQSCGNTIIYWFILDIFFFFFFFFFVVLFFSIFVGVSYIFFLLLTNLYECAIGILLNSMIVIELFFIYLAWFVILSVEFDLFYCWLRMICVCLVSESLRDEIREKIFISKGFFPSFQDVLPFSLPSPYTRIIEISTEPKPTLASYTAKFFSLKYNDKKTIMYYVYDCVCVRANPFPMYRWCAMLFSK